MRNFPRSAMIVLCLAAFAFTASVIFSRTVFERLPHLEDEIAYLFQAKVFAAGELSAPLVSPGYSFWQPFVIDLDGQRFGKYPPGWPAQLAVGVGLGAPWIINAWLAALSVVLAWRLAREVFGRDAGVIAAALMAFSPMALLLNATLMSHTSALFAVMLFMWAYRRLTVTHGRAALPWALLAGLGLGLLAANRALTAAAIALPFVVWSGLRVLLSLRGGLRAAGRTLAPLLILSVATLAVFAVVPLFNAAVAGDPSANLYTLLPGWEYDRIGFGEGIGRNGHTLTKGIQFARFDLSLTAADLFGWQLAPWSDLLNDWAVGVAPPGQIADSYWPTIGISWIFIPLAFVLGFRREWAYVWALFGVIWVSLAGNFQFSAPELWSAAGILWAVTPLVFIARRRPDERQMWTWLLFSVIFCTVAAYMTYWIGSQRYSTRYYFEALGSAAILSAVPIAWLMARWRRVVTVALCVLMAWSLVGYSLPRVGTLYRYNRISPAVLEGIAERRQGDRPVLAVVIGRDARWRTRGALMAVSSPFLNGQLQFVHVNGAEDRFDLMHLFPSYQVIELGGRDNDLWFLDTCDASGVCEIIN